jgi:hypothetical protein
MSAKIIVDGIQIWVEDGAPRCRPGSIEDALPRISKAMELADKWIEAVAAQQRELREHQLTKAEERRVKTLMRILKCNREQAIRELRDVVDDF